MDKSAQRAWWQRPNRVLLINLREGDEPRIDPDRLIEGVKEFSATAFCINGGGIVAFYQTRIADHPKSAGLRGRDLLAELVPRAHAQNLHVLARIDPSCAPQALAQTHPELGGVHANLGLIYRQAGKATESVAAFEQAVRVSPEQAVFHNQLGIAYRQQGQFKPAQAAYERALALDASYAAAQLNLAILHDMYLGDSARALELYERYLALPTQKDAAVTKWVAELKNRKPEQQLASKKVPS